MQRLQRRTVSLLLLTQILGGVGVAIGISVGALLLEDLTGTSALAGLGQSSAVVGGALLAIPIVRVTGRWGRRGGLTLAYGCGSVGAICVVAGLYLSNASVAFLGMFLLGGGTAANLQARYAAVDLADDLKRGRQLSLIVWATTIGAVAGPSLAPLADTAIQRVTNAPNYAGPFIGSAIGFAIAALALWLFLRPDPLLTARAHDVETIHTKPTIASGFTTVRTNQDARSGIIAVSLGHFVMVAVMAMAPIHIKHSMVDQDLVTVVVGIVLSLHIAGMYALSPLAGIAVDKYGSQPVIFVGAALLFVACVISGTAGHNNVQLAFGLILLGLGWSCTMIAGSAMLTNAVQTHQRAAVQGMSDLTMGLAGATAGAASGFIIEATNYLTLTLMAAIIIIPITVAMTRTRTPTKVTT